VGTPAHRDKLLASLHIFAITAIVIGIIGAFFVMLAGSLHKSYEGIAVFCIYRIFKEIGIYLDRLELSVYLLVITVPYLKSVSVKLDDLKKITFLRCGGFAFALISLNLVNICSPFKQKKTATLLLC